MTPDSQARIESERPHYLTIFTVSRSAKNKPLHRARFFSGATLALLRIDSGTRQPHFLGILEPICPRYQIPTNYPVESGSFFGFVSPRCLSRSPSVPLFLSSPLPLACSSTLPFSSVPSRPVFLPAPPCRPTNQYVGRTGVEAEDGSTLRIFGPEKVVSGWITVG